MYWPWIPVTVRISLYCEYLSSFGKIIIGFWDSCSVLSFSKHIYLRAEVTLPDILPMPKQTVFVSFVQKNLVNRFYFGRSKFLISQINECVASDIFRIWNRFIWLGVIFSSSQRRLSFFSLIKFISDNLISTC